jgi:arsenite oxidase small subunit
MGPAFEQAFPRSAYASHTSGYVSATSLAVEGSSFVSSIWSAIPTCFGYQGIRPRGSSSVVESRRVLAGLGAGGIATLAGCQFGAQQRPRTEAPPDSPTERVARLDKYPRVEVGAVGELSPGDISTFAYPLNAQENFLTRLSEDAWGGVGPDGDIVAYSTVCTHMGCSIGSSVSPDDGTAGPCPCHYTSYDLSKGGLTVVGPATTDLPQIDLEVEDGTIYATGVDGLMFGYRNNLRDGEPVVDETGDGETSTPTATDTETGSGGTVDFGGWFDDVDNYDGSIADRTGQGDVTVTVGADGNGGTFAFAPPAVRVSSGTTVTFEWGSDTHNVLVESQPSGAGWNGHDPIENEGFSFSHTFGTSGTYTYFCDPHLSLGMKGAIVVE